MLTIGYGVEGVTDAPVAEHLIRLLGRQPRVLSNSGGTPALDPRILKWNVSSLNTPILVLRDWDVRDGVECVPTLLSKVCGGELRTQNLVLRVPVRSIEAWLLADTDAFKEYFNVAKVPLTPDEESTPKVALVSACRKSKSADIRNDMVPTVKSGKVVGTLYAPRIVDFASNHWDAIRAAQNSPSLFRAVTRLRALVKAGAI
jgi:hypothetical protein